MRFMNHVHTRGNSPCPLTSERSCFLSFVRMDEYWYFVRIPGNNFLCDVATVEAELSAIDRLFIEIVIVADPV